MELGEAEAAAHERDKRLVARPEGFDELWVEFFVESHSRAPREVWLDLDASDDPLHGHQEGRFFHGDYRCYCYLPLYIVCGEHLLCARLRESNQDASAAAFIVAPASRPGDCATSPTALANRGATGWWARRSLCRRGRIRGSW